MTTHFLSKRITLIASVVTLFIGSVYATPVDPNRALNVAEQFMPSKPTHKKNAKGTPQQLSEIVYTHYMPQSGRPAIYVVNLNGGFALISADDVAHPVLGYNYGKPWPTNVDSIAPSVKGFLDDLAAQMEAASGHPQDAATAAEWRQPNRSANRAPRRTTADSSLPDSVGPLLTTTWTKGSTTMPCVQWTKMLHSAMMVMYPLAVSLLRWHRLSSTGQTATPSARVVFIAMTATTATCVSTTTPRLMISHTCRIS